jgi:hypothetical protein
VGAASVMAIRSSLWPRLAWLASDPSKGRTTWSATASGQHRAALPLSVTFLRNSIAHIGKGVCPGRLHVRDLHQVQTVAGVKDIRVGIRTRSRRAS